jgi:hypothetical protein
MHLCYRASVENYNGTINAILKLVTSDTIYNDTGIIRTQVLAMKWPFI